MAKDVIITPASGLVDFKDTSGNSDAIIELDDLGNLNISNPGGELSIGDGGGNLFIGDGINSVDIIFEQNGAVRALTGKTLTVGSAGSNVNLSSITTFSANVVLGSSGVSANGSFGTAAQVLHSNGTAAYWAADDQGVTSVASGNGLTGGPITTTGTLAVGAGSGISVNATAVAVLANNGLTANATGVYVVPGNGLVTANSTGVHVGAGSGVTVNATAVAINPNTGIVANATGVYVNATYIGTISANNASFLGTVAAASYVQNTDSRTLSGNLVFTGANVFLQSAALGGTATNFVNNYIINTSVVGNASFLRFYHFRHTTGTDWTGASTRIQQRIDSTDMGYLEFNPSGFAQGLGVYGSTGKGLTVNQTGQSTFGNTVILGSVGLSANGSLGTAAQVLHSNGTAAYWAVDDQGVTSVASGNGLTGGPITTTGTLAVGAGNGITVNATAVAVLANTGVVANATGVHIGQAVATTSNVQFGSLGVGTAASGVTGEIRANNNITAFYTSDIRLKENIKNIESPIDKIKLINGVEFDWTDAYIKEHGGEDGYFIRKHDVGVIAQEIEKILPEVVATKGDGIKAVKYDRIVALLIEAIKDQQKQIDELKNIINR